MSDFPLTPPWRSAYFPSNGTFTVPAGVHLVYVEVVGGGAGVARGTAGVAGGATTVTSGAKSVSHPGMASHPCLNGDGDRFTAAAANSGLPGRKAFMNSGAFADGTTDTQQNKVITLFGTLTTTPGGSVTVTIGAGGSSTGNGGSGHANIYYEV